MKNFVQSGDVVQFENNTGVLISSGSVIPVDDRILIAAHDIPAGETGSANLTGVYKLPKKVGEAISQGNQLYWDKINKELTKVAGNNNPAGIAFGSIPADSSTADVRLETFPRIPKIQNIAPLIGTPDLNSVNILVLRGQIEGRLDVIENKISELIKAMQISGLMEA